MSEDKNKLGAMFEKALANRGAKSKEETDEEEKISNEEVKVQETSAEERIEIESSKEDIIDDADELEEELKEEFDKQFHEALDSEEEELDYDEDEEEAEHDNQTTMIKIEDLEDYPDQPFRAYSEEKENEMMDSIKVNGIIQDLIVRPLENGKYQILSGHNRKRCAEKLGFKELPCKVKDVDDDEAKLMLVDTNLIQRKEFYPSETAKALKIKREIYRKKDVKSDFFGEISKEQNMSRGNVQRYLRLNFLTPEMMERVDNKEMTIKIAEDISFLTKEEQDKLNSILEAKPRKITANQAKRLREESDGNNLSEKTFKEILENNEKVEIKDIEIKFTKDEVTKYFKDFSNAKEIKEWILSMFDELLSPEEKEQVEDGNN